MTLETVAELTVAMLRAKVCAANAPHLLQSIFGSATRYSVSSSPYFWLNERRETLEQMCNGVVHAACARRVAPRNLTNGRS